MLYKGFIRPILPQAGFLSHPPPTSPAWKNLWILCRVVAGCLSSILIPLLNLEALPPLHVTLTHRSLSYFKFALRLPSSFPLAFLAHHNPCTRLKKGSWRSFSSSHNRTPNLQLPREPLILCPPKPPCSTLSHTNFLPHLQKSHKNCKKIPQLSKTKTRSKLAMSGRSIIGCIDREN